MIQNAPTRYNILEEVVEWRKFQRISHILYQLLETSFTNQQIMACLEIITTRADEGDEDAAAYSDYRNKDSEKLYQIMHTILTEHRVALTRQELEFRRSYKFLMIKPLIIKMLQKIADDLFPIVPEIARQFASSVDQRAAGKSAAPRPHD